MGAGGRRGEEEAAGAALHMARSRGGGGGEGWPAEPSCGWRASARTSGERRRLRPGLAAATAPAAQAPHVVGFPRMHLPRPPPAHRPAPSAPRAPGCGFGGRAGRGLFPGHPGGGDEAYALEHPRGCGAGKACQRNAWSSLLYPPGFFEGTQTVDSQLVIAFSAPRTTDNGLLLYSARFLPKVCWA